MGKAPSPPDPQDTAAASTGTNINTAIANAIMGNANYSTPFGSSTTTQTGTQTITDPYTGQTYEIPTFTNTQTLSPELQGLMDAQLGNQQAIAGAASGLAGQIGNIAQPVKGPNLQTSVGARPGVVQRPGYGLDGSTTTGGQTRPSGGIQTSLGDDDFSADRQRVEDALMGRLNTQLDRDMAAERTRLLNSGLREGSPAFEAAMRDLNTSAAEHRTSAILGAGQEQNRLQQLALNAGNFANAAQAQQYGQDLSSAQFANQANQQMFQNSLTGQNAAINNLMGLMGGSQVNAPNFPGFAAPTIPTTDVAGLINANYGQQMQQFGANQGILGGIMGGIGSLIGLSDERTKKDVEKRGEIDGMGIYDFHYRGEPSGAPKRTGLMAQEVARKKPGAVKRRDGLMYVDYGKALS